MKGEEGNIRRRREYNEKRVIKGEEEGKSRRYE